MRWLLIPVLLVILAEPALAERKRRRYRRVRAPRTPVVAGFMAGPVFSYGDTDGTRTDSRKGMSLFAYVEKRLKGILYFQPELGYSRRFADDATIDYVEAPLFLKVKAGFLSRSTMLSFFGGPAVAVAAGRSDPDRFAPWDLRMEAGVGMEQRISRTMAIHAGMRFSTGLIDIDRNATLYRTRGFLVLFGVQGAF